MSEAAFSFTTKVNGDLFTVRGNSLDEFMGNIGMVQASLQGIIGDLTAIQAGGHAAPLLVASAPQQPPAAAPAPTWQAAPPAPAAAPPQQPQQWGAPPPSPQGGWQPQGGAPSGHLCECGLDMKLRNGRNGSFYSCSKRMDDPTRCRKTLNV